MEELIERCNIAVFELSRLAKNYHTSGNIVEYNRIIAKIDGVELAISYATQILREKSSD